MFGLAQQVGGAELAVHRLVGDDEGLGGAGEQVDADAAVELALGFGDEGVARPDEHVDRLDALGADGHRGHRLHAAEDVDLVGAGHVLGGDDRRSRLAVEGRGAGDDPAATGDLCRQHRHMRRRQQRILAARHVAANRRDRDMPVPQDHAGQGLDLELGHRRLLLFGEVAHLGLCEGDVLEVLPAELGHRGVDLGLRQAEIRAVPAVELARQLANGVIATLFDVREDGLHGLANLPVRLGALLDRFPLLEPPRHSSSPSAQAFATLSHVGPRLYTPDRMSVAATPGLRPPVTLASGAR